MNKNHKNDLKFDAIFSKKCHKYSKTYLNRTFYACNDRKYHILSLYYISNSKQWFLLKNNPICHFVTQPQKHLFVLAKYFGHFEGEKKSNYLQKWFKTVFRHILQLDNIMEPLKYVYCQISPNVILPFVSAPLWHDVTTFTTSFLIFLQ